MQTPLDQLAYYSGLTPEQDALRDVIVHALRDATATACDRFPFLPASTAYVLHAVRREVTDELLSLRDAIALELIKRLDDRDLENQP